MQKKYPSIACCGIDCGLCPRLYTDGSSRCPGCFGEDFAQKRPPCSIANCCVKKHGYETCGECAEFPCLKYDFTKDNKDSFTTHKKMMTNLEYIQKHGVERFVEEQKVKIEILQLMLSKYNDGRSKSFYCLAVALLSVESLKKVMSADFEDRKKLKELLCKYAEEQGVELKQGK